MNSTVTNTVQPRAKVLAIAAALVFAPSVFGQSTPTVDWGGPLRYVGNAKPDPDKSDGGLPWVVGVQNYQVLRASRLYASLSDDQGWTFHHAPMLVYWNAKFYTEWIASPVQENGLPTDVMMSSSSDGRHWRMPIVIFPQWDDYDDPYHPVRSQLHQRMGFYVAPNGRLLAISHYGLWNDEKNEIFGGPGHVAREVHEDGTLGPIYFLRFGKGWDASKSPYPFYASSSDQGFNDACNALLANKFVTDQWFELEVGYPSDAYIQIPGMQTGPEEALSRRKALSFFTRKDGAVVAIWKRAWTSISTDHGKTWSVPVQAPGVAQTFAKLWGQKTSDGRYALAYDPFESPPGYRYPLTVTTSNDGITFDQMLVVFGDLPFRRYPGLAKSNGPQYVRGIEEANPQPPDGAMWLVCSVNKEDIWVSRIPVPIRGTVDSPIHEEFDGMETGGIVSDWNIYSPRWAPVEVVNFPSAQNKSLQLTDADPYDYARAIRVLPLSRRGVVSLKIFAKQADGEMDIELDTPTGDRPVQIVLNDKGRIHIPNVRGGAAVDSYSPNRWLTFTIDFDCQSQTYSVHLDRKLIATNVKFAEPATAIQRLSLRTGPYQPTHVEQSNAKSEAGFFVGNIDPLTDHPLKSPAVFYVDSIHTK